MWTHVLRYCSHSEALVGSTWALTMEMRKNQQNVITIWYSPSSSSAGGHPIFSTSSATVPFQQQNLQTPTYTSIAEKKEEEIYDTFMETKRRNEVLKANTYNEFWKQKNNSQSRLLLAFDSEKGRMRMAFLEAQIPQPKIVVDYKKTYFEFDARNIQLIE